MSLRWIALLLVGAAGCQSSSGSLCGKGQEAQYGGHTFCYYSKAITEEGFDCPPSLPHALPLGDLEVCSDQGMLPPGLDGYLDGKMGVDGGTTGGGCDDELTCLPPSGSGGDQICVAGRVFDAATHVAIDGTTAGQIEVRLYEPLSFLADPTTPPFRTLTVANGGLDACGRYLARISLGQDGVNGLVMVATAGRTGTASQGTYTLALTQATAIPNLNIPRLPAFLVANTQHAAWSAQAGLSTDFAAAGTTVVRVHTPEATPAYFPGTPIAGLSLQWTQAGPPTSQASYFSDDSTDTLTTIAPAQTSTGRDGVAFLRIGKGIGDLSAPTGAVGTCRTPAGAAGQLAITGSLLTGGTPGALVFYDLEATCN